MLEKEEGESAFGGAEPPPDVTSVLAASAVLGVNEGVGPAVVGVEKGVCPEVLGVDKGVCPEVLGVDKGVCPEVLGVDEGVCPEVEGGVPFVLETRPLALTMV